MKHRPINLGLTLAALLLFGIEPGRLRRVRADEKPKGATVIAGDQIYTTCDERSPKYLHYDSGDPNSKLFLNFVGSFSSGASNVFLVRGENVADAMKASYQIFGRGVRADEAAQPDENTKSSRLWFGGFLGVAGSSPPRWIVKSIEIDDKRIRLKYVTNKDGGATDDIHAYVVLAQLGSASPATYTLELFDLDKNEVTLMRRVTAR